MKHTSPDVLRVVDRPFFKNIDSICKRIGVDVDSVRLGYMRRSSAIHPFRPKITLWWPAETHKNWENHLSGNGLVFSSRAKKQPFSIADIIKNADTEGLFAIFFREANGPYGYRFVGLFDTDVEQSKLQNRHVFKRVSTELEV